MKKLEVYLVGLSLAALLLFPLAISAQRTTLPPGKFRKVENAITNSYIVVLNDDAVSKTATANARRAQVSAIAGNFAGQHGGRVGFIYETALTGFSIELPNELAAIAISRSPRVKYVEEDSLGHVVDTQFNPPWNLDRIDQESTTLNSQYVFNATGAGVTAYVIDTGIRSTHNEFGGRASIAADFVGSEGCNTSGNNDCHSHGTHVAGTVGGSTYGVAKGVTIRSIKVCDQFGGCTVSATVNGINFATNEHNATGNRAVANMSLRFPATQALDDAVRGSLNAGVSYAIAAGNDNANANLFSPQRVGAEAIIVGASDSLDQKTSFSNFGSIVDLFAPGFNIISATNTSNTAIQVMHGTSMASPHVAGAVALYLQGRTSMTGCSAHPKQGPSTTSGSSISTCPDRVNQFIASNATLNQLSFVPTDTPNRLLFTGSLPTTTNPIDNGRFFFWQQYVDFLNRDPDNGGLLFYVNILNGCGADTECINATRAALSANFVRSPEFSGRGGYVANLFNIVFGQRPKTVAELSDPSKVERPHYAEFTSDWATLTGTDAEVDPKKSQLAVTWLGRAEVQAILPNSLTNQQFVQKLEATAGVTLANESTLIANLNSGSQTRAQVLRAVAESSEVVTKFRLQNFVTVQYIGHLRREPEDCHGSPDPANCGYIFHYNRFPPTGDPAATENVVTRGFIESPEYRHRFGP
jgi:subtilisin family serine protease